MSEAAIESLRLSGTFERRYEIVRCIKLGGMGAIYEVIHSETRRRRVLKVLLPNFATDADLRGRLRQEARIAAEIDSEHIVEVLDAGVSTLGQPFLVMEFLTGEDLGAVLSRRGALPREEVLEFVHQASLALSKTHAAGIVHRDLKPENLFVTRRDDGTPRLKLLDFGIAKLIAQTTHAKTTRNFGTPLYMSPEQVRGDGSVGAPADLYAMTHVAFALLVGEAYWASEARELGHGFFRRVARGLPEAASFRAARRGITLAPAFDTWFARGTALEPGARFETASQLCEELALALGVAKPGAHAGPPIGSRTLSFGSPGPTVGAALIALGCVAAGAWAIQRRFVLNERQPTVASPTNVASSLSHAGPPVVPIPQEPARETPEGTSPAASRVPAIPTPASHSQPKLGLEPRTRSEPQSIGGPKRANPTPAREYDPSDIR